jgi:hypothetical protein
MRWIPRLLGAALLVVLVAQPAAADKVILFTMLGDADAIEFATPAMDIDLFLWHENGKVYRANTGSRGVAVKEIPLGVIRGCQAYQEDSILASWTCNIPIGIEALEKMRRASNMLSETDSPIPPGDSRLWVASNLAIRQENPSRLCDGCAYALGPPARPGLILAGIPGKPTGRIAPDTGSTQGETKTAAGLDAPPRVVIRIHVPGRGSVDLDIGSEEEVKEREERYRRREERKQEIARYYRQKREDERWERDVDLGITIFFDLRSEDVPGHSGADGGD